MVQRTHRRGGLEMNRNLNFGEKLPVSTMILASQGSLQVVHHHKKFQVRFVKVLFREKYL